MPPVDLKSDPSTFGGPGSGPRPGQGVKATLIGARPQPTPVQQVALNYYLADGFADLNDGLRGVAELTPEAEAAVEPLKSFVDAGSFPTDATVFRAYDLTPEQVQGDTLEPGTTFTDPAFLSASLHPADANEGEYVVAVAVPKGATGVYVGDLHNARTVTDQEKGEVLLPPGSTIEITGRDANDIIHARLVTGAVAASGAQFGGPGSGPRPGYKRDRETPASGTGTADDPIRTSNVDEAAQALGEGKYVDLDQPDQLSTLLDKMKATVAEARKLGAKAPIYDLCKVSAAGTNLFCAETKGVPRAMMPQLSGIPEPGSKADRELPKDAKGGVNLGEGFIEHLQSNGIKVTGAERLASHLRASQNELNGAKVAAMMDKIESGATESWSERPIFVTRDNYVIDGHHRWAANVGLKYTAGEDLTMPVNVVDMDIIPALTAANAYAADMGMPQADVSKMNARIRLSVDRRRREIFGGPGSGPRPGYKRPKKDNEGPGVRPPYLGPVEPRGGWPEKSKIPYKGRILPETEEAIERLAEAAPEPSESQLAAIETYTGWDHRVSDHVVNDALRNKVPMTPEAQETIVELESYLEGATIPEDIMVYRGLRLDEGAIRSLVPGSTFQNPGFTSTTMTPPGTVKGEPSRADNATARVEIAVPKGTKGAAYVSEFSAIGPSDREVLFAPNLNLRVDSVEYPEPTSQYPASTVIQASIVESHSVPIHGDRGAARIAASIAKRRGQLGGPGSGPRPGFKRGGVGTLTKAQVDKMTPEQRTARIAEIRGGMRDSQTKFKVDGKYVPERAALHQQAISKFLDHVAPPEGKPTATFLGGGPAAGKSTVLQSDGVNVPDDNGGAPPAVAVLVNADLLKEVLPEYRDLALLGDKNAAGFAHEESSDMSKMLVAAALEKGVHVNIDGTGDANETKRVNEITRARDAGHTVNAVYVTVPTEIAVERNLQRYEDAKARGEIPRMVPEDVVRGTHAGVSAVFPKIAGQFDNAVLYSTDVPRGEAPILIAQADRGSELNVVDEKLYNDFTGKAAEVPGAGGALAMFADDPADDHDDLLVAMAVDILNGVDFHYSEADRAQWDRIESSIEATRRSFPDAIIDIPFEMVPGVPATEMSWTPQDFPGTSKPA